MNNKTHKNENIQITEIQTLHEVFQQMLKLENIKTVEELTTNTSNLYDPLINFHEDNCNNEIDVESYLKILDNQENNRFGLTAYTFKFDNLLENYTTINYNDPDIDE